MSQPFRYDWLGALNRITEAGEDPASFCLYCLPKAGVLLLTALLERGRWPATYRTEGVDHLTDEEWQFLTDIVDDTEVGLMSNCDTIITNIVNQVTNNVTSVVHNIQAAQDMCCYIDQTGAPMEEPDPSEEPPGPTNERGHRCARAMHAHDTGEEFLGNIWDYLSAGGTLTAGVLAFFLLALANPATFPVALVSLVIAAIVAAALLFNKSEILAVWGSLQVEIACCFFTSETATEAKTCIDEKIDAATEDISLRFIFKSIYNQEQVNNIWEGAEGYGQGGYTGEECADCVLPGGALEVLGFGFRLAAAGIAPGCQDNHWAVYWGSEGIGTSSDLVNTPGGVNPSMGDFLTNHEVINPNFHPEYSEVPSSFEHGDDQPVTAHHFAPLGCSKILTCANSDIYMELTDWKVLVRAWQSTDAPVWIPTHIDHLEGGYLNTGAFSLSGDNRTLFIDSAGGLLPGSGIFLTRVWLYIPPAT